MRRIALVALAMSVVLIPSAVAVVPASYTTALNNLLNGTPTNAEHKALAREGYNHDVRQDDLLAALEARIAALEGPPPPPPGATAVLSPLEGATVSGQVPVVVSVAANTGWVGVYACGGQPVGEDLEPDGNGNYQVSWDSTIPECANGDQRVDVWSYTDAGAETGFDDVTVNVQNAPPPPPPPPGSCAGAEPGPIAGQGYAQAFGDCFDTLDRTVWHNRLWYESAAPASSQYAQDGVLHLVSRRSDGYPNVTVGTDTPGNGSPVAADKRFQRGYFEARVRWTGGQGSWPAFWMLSYAHANNGSWPSPACPNPDCLSAELDVMEGQGADPNDFYGTVHRNSCGCYGVANQQNSNNWHPQPFPLADTWHTYSAKWTAAEVSWYIDGVLSHSAPVWDSFNQPMFLILQMWTGGWTGGTDTTTPDELHTEVDWVRVWQEGV